VADVRGAVAWAQDGLAMNGKRTVLFIDEIHRFNKAQEDALLPYVEDGTITLTGTTTENPYLSYRCSRVRLTTPRNGRALPQYGESAEWSAAKGRGAWVMIQGKNQATRYVQSGYWMFGNAFDCWHHFSEYNNGGGTVAKEGPCTNLNQVHVPLVTYIPNPARTELWIDSLRLDVMNSCVCAFARPLWVDYLGESQDSHSDVPGLSATKGEWSSMQIQYFTDNTWHGTCGTITLFKDVTLARYAADAPACNDTRSWTATP